MSYDMSPKQIVLTALEAAQIEIIYLQRLLNRTLASAPCTIRLIEDAIVIVKDMK